MQYLIKFIVSSLFGYVGEYLGGFIDVTTSYIVAFILSIIGWYFAKHWLKRLGV